jgi:ketosteroid isomerase-like protein
VSEANIEIIRRGWQAYEQGGIEAILPFYSQDCVIVDAPEIPDAVTRRGWEGLTAVFGNFTGMWNQLSLKPEEFIEVGEDVVVAVYAMEGSGRDSGTPVHTSMAIVYDIDSGVIVRHRNFVSREAALEAARDQGNRAE